MAIWTIEDLKRHLGPGLGLRANKYLIEIPVPGSSGKSLAMGCKSVSLPGRTIETKTIFYRGRKYNVRGLTDYGNNITLSFIDDCNSSLRKIFDNWLTSIDNSTQQSKPSNKTVGNALATVAGAVDFASKSISQIALNGWGNFAADLFSNNLTAPFYQITVNVWQTDQNQNKVYGYSLTNAFPSAIAASVLSDENDSVATFDVTLTFSEFVSIQDNIADSLINKLGSKIPGFGDAQKIFSGAKNIVDTVKSSKKSASLGNKLGKFF